MSDLESTIDAVSVPIIALKADLTIAAANERAFKTFAELALGCDIHDVFSKKRSLRRLLRQSLELSLETSMILKAKEGLGSEFLTSIKPLDQMDSATSARLLLTFEDRSSLREIKTMRSDFVANVSHEIRSPLTALSGFVETLQTSAKDDPVAQVLFLDLMAKEAARMTHLVTDLLSLSQVEMKERRVVKKLANMNQVIDQAVATVDNLAQTRGKTLIDQSPKNLPTLRGKQEDLVRLLINLLENAINYGRANSNVYLTTQVVTNDNPLHKPALIIAIQDEGDGIPAEEIPRLTERFYRVDKSRSRNVGGTGLGLAIVKHILVRHRGKLEIESVPGQGSTFRILLPLDKIKET